MFEGVVIKRRGGGISETFTVRKISYGVGVERTFPINSPKIDKIEVARRGKVRRAKLYYLRELRGKARELKKFVVNYKAVERGLCVYTSPFCISKNRYHAKAINREGRWVMEKDQHQEAIETNVGNRPKG